MSARESWTKRRSQRDDRGDATPSRALTLTGPMNAVDCCDRCGAQAYVRVFLHGPQELLFCAHHDRQHAPALAKIAVGIQDESGRLARREWPG
jgi:hypothetical protein